MWLPAGFWAAPWVLSPAPPYKALRSTLTAPEGGSYMFTVLWILWGAAFAVIEAVALVRDARGDTLSEHFRLWFRTDTRKGRTVWMIVSGLFFAWFTVHIAVAGSA